MSPPIRLIIRHLPPSLPPDTLHTSILAHTQTQDEITNYTYIPGKRFARAYITFSSVERAKKWGKAYHRHRFVDKNGKEDFAIVEFAPFQRVPRPDKVDAKNGTILQDPIWLDYQQTLAKEAEKAKMTIEQQMELLTIKKEKEMKDRETTPLLQFLKATRSGHFKAGGFAKTAASPRNPQQPIKPGSVASNSTGALNKSPGKGANNMVSDKNGPIAQNSTKLAPAQGNPNGPRMNGISKIPSMNNVANAKGAAQNQQTARNAQPRASPNTSHSPARPVSVTQQAKLTKAVSTPSLGETDKVLKGSTEITMSSASQDIKQMPTKTPRKRNNIKKK